MVIHRGGDAELIRQLKVQLARSRARYRALRNRRSVRLALALAGVVAKIKKLGGPPSVLPAPVVHEPPPPPQQSPQAWRPVTDRPWNAMLAEMAVSPGVSVLVPVYDAFEAFERCVEHLVRNTSTAVGIVFIDDASPDPRVASLLDALSEREGVRVLRNAENLGFTRTVNRGFAEIEGDVIVLNSDTRVPPRWVERLRWAAYAAPDIASATAISDNAGAFSAPGVGADVDLDADVAARRVLRRSDWVFPDTPTANGFCMYVKRRALDDVGFFDVEKYPRGYGEENDWSMRAAALGWRHVVDDTTYVRHERSASFGTERLALSAAGTARLSEDFPEYPALAQAFVHSPSMAAVRSSVAAALDPSGESVRPRVLLVLHDMGGGTPQTNRDLVAGLGERYEGLVLISTGQRLQLTDAGGELIDDIILEEQLTIGDEHHPGYRYAFAEILAVHDIDVIHIRHLMKHSLDIPAVAQQMGLPVVLSVHDYYLLCPTAHLVDNAGRFCGGTCTPGQGTCVASRWVRDGPHLKHGWVHVWRRRVSKMLPHVDVVVAASDAAADLLRAAPDVPFAAADWEVIEHGRDLQRFDAGAFPTGAEPARILLAGHIGYGKGSDLVRELKRIDEADRLEFHVIGTFDGEVPPGVVVHGRYDREDFGPIVEAIRPAAMAILSVTAETYSHTLTEAWSAGLPVFVTDRGAPPQRVLSTGGGWVLDDDPAVAYRRIVEVLSDPTEYARRRRDALAATWPDVASMASRYADLYDRLRSRRRTVSPPPEVTAH